MNFELLGPGVHTAGAARQSLARGLCARCAARPPRFSRFAVSLATAWRAAACLQP